MIKSKKYVVKSEHLYLRYAVEATEYADLTKVDKFECNGGSITSPIIMLPAKENCILINCQLNGEVSYGEHHHDDLG